MNNSDINTLYSNGIWCKNSIQLEEGDPLSPENLT